MSFEETTLIIPTLNEVENIPLLFETLDGLYPDINIIISDGGSIDGTQKLVKKKSAENEKVRLLGNSNFRGLCENVIQAALLADKKYIVVMDADLQHPPEKIKEIVGALKKDYDIVVATRRKIQDWSFSRNFMSKVATLLGKICLFLRGRKRPNDLLSGFFGVKTDLFQKMIKKNLKRFELGGYKVLFDLLKIIPRETTIGEVNYTFRGRQKGESKIKSKHIFFFLKSLLK